MNDYDDRFLDETIEFWHARTGRPMTREDAREVTANISGFFGLLLEWDAAAKACLASERGVPARLDPG